MQKFDVTFISICNKLGDFTTKKKTWFNIFQGHAMQSDAHAVWLEASTWRLVLVTLSLHGVKRTPTIFWNSRICYMLVDKLNSTIVKIQNVFVPTWLVFSVLYINSNSNINRHVFTVQLHSL